MINIIKNVSLFKKENKIPNKVKKKHSFDLRKRDDTYDLNSFHINRKCDTYF